MNKVLVWLDKWVTPVASKIGSQRHLSVIRRGFLLVIPLIFLGSFFTLIPNIYGLTDFFAPWASAFSFASDVTFGLISVYLTIAIATLLSKSYNMDSISVAIIAVVVFVAAASGVSTDADGNKSISLAFLGSYGMLGSILTTIYTVEFYKLLREKGIFIKAPKDLAPIIMGLVENIIPYIIIFLPIWILAANGIQITKVISTLFASLFKMSDTIGATYLAHLIENFSYFIGIHPWSIIGPIYFPFLWSNTVANAEAFAAGKPLPHVVTYRTYYGGAQGGSGSTLPLVIFGLFSKSRTLKTISRTALIPSIFGINEPVVFGYPVALNPVFFIPLVLICPFVETLYVLLVSLNWIPRTAVVFFAYLPSGVLNFLSTPQAPWLALLANLALFPIFAMVWYPFFKIHERQVMKEESVPA